MSAAARGFLAFSVFGLVESLFGVLLPRVLGARCGSLAEPAWLPLALTCGYGAAGAVLAWLTARSTGADPGAANGRGRIDLGLLVGLLAALAVATLAQPTVGRASQAALLTLIAAQLALGVVLTRRGRSGLPALIGFSLVFLGVPWITRQALYEHPGRTRWGWALAWAVAVPMVVWLAARVLRSSGKVRGGAWALPVVLALASAVAVLGLDRAHQPASPRGARKAPNVVLIVMDTVRADHLSVYGYARQTTPELARLAREATVYDRAIAASDVSLTSHASLFTGLYGRHHGAHGPENGASSQAPSPLSGRFETLAERLHDRNYRTSAVTANVSFLGRPFNLQQGFDDYIVLGGACCTTTPFEAWRRAARVAGEPRVYVSGDVVARDVTRLVDLGRRGDRPFFIFANFMDAHTPHSPPAPYLDRFWDGQPETRRIASYDGSLAYLDLQIGRVVEHLRSAGILDETLLIVTADHGEALGERGLYGHDGVAVYQGLVHVPLIVRYPGVSEARRVTTPVSSIDVVPTVLEAVGAAPAPGVAESLFHPRADRVAISESFPSIVSKQRRHMQRAVFAGSLKLVVDDTGRVELFDLDQDPREERNLATPDDPRVRQLAAELERWRGLPSAEASGPAELDQESVDRLRALGYVN